MKNLDIRKSIIYFIKKETVLFIATILAIITSFIIKPSKEYLDYIDYKTLATLFCMLVVISGLKKTNVFDIVSKKMIGFFHTRRSVIYALVFGTFFFDMIVANDMSLITFLPFGTFKVGAFFLIGIEKIIPA